MQNPFAQYPKLRDSLLAMLLLFVITALFFRPLFQGKTLALQDTRLAYATQQDLRDYLEETGERPYWSMRMFSGMPSVPLWFPVEGNVLADIQQALGLGLPYPVGHLFWGMLWMFLLLRLFRVNPWMAAAGAFSFQFCSYYINIIEVGHLNKFYALMYFPAVLVGITLVLRKKWLLGGVTLFLTMGLEVLSYHVQMAYYLAFVILAYVLWGLIRLLRQEGIKTAALAGVVMLAAAALGTAVNLSGLLPIRDYAEYSIRGPSELKRDSEQAKIGGLDKDYAYGWSYGRAELLTLLIPNAAGGGSTQSLPKSSSYYEFLMDRGVPESQWKQYKNPQAVGFGTYWGDMAFTSGPFYVGALVCFLFVVGLYLVRSGLKWALLYVTLLFALLCLGANSLSLPAALGVLLLPLVFMLTHRRLPDSFPKPALGLALAVVGVLIFVLDSHPEDNYKLSDLFFDYFPLYNKFRAPSSMLVITALTMPWLGLLGARELLDNQRDPQERLRAIYYAAGVTAGLCLLVAVAGQAFFDFQRAQEDPSQLEPRQRELYYIILDDRFLLMQLDALRSAGFILVAAAVFWAYAKGYLKQAWLPPAVLLALTVLDILGVNSRYINEETFITQREFDDFLKPREAGQYLTQNDTTYHRVFPLSRNPFNESSAAVAMNSIGGYSAAKIRRYQQLISQHLNARGGFSPNVLNMLNVKYVLAPQQLQVPGFVQVYQTNEGRQSEIVYLNQYAYGPAWINQNVLVAPIPDVALDTLNQVNSYMNAVVEAKDTHKLGDYSTDSIRFEQEYIRLVGKPTNTELSYEFKSDKNRFVTFSEIYFEPGWKAYIDGEEAPIVQTNFVLRGMTIPKGEHTITFRYHYEIISESKVYSQIMSGILLLSIALALFVELRRNKTIQTPMEEATAYV